MATIGQTPGNRSMLTKLRRWWQLQSGQVDTPIATDVPWWVVSLVLHVTLVLALAKILLPSPTDREVRLTAAPDERIALEDPVPEVKFDEVLPEPVGETALDQFEFSETAVPLLELDREEFLESIQPPSEIGDLMIEESFEAATADRVSTVPVKGSVGNAVASASGAVDRITEEIILSLEQRDTLVVWLFDRSPSMMEQRDEIAGRLERIYAELETLASFRKDEADPGRAPPLLTQVYTFGQGFDRMLDEPASTFEPIREAFNAIRRDDSGMEYVFSAVIQTINDFKSLRKVNRLTGERERNVMVIVVSDEAGDDAARLDECVQKCNQHEIPVFVVGVPAPFGRAETLVKWVDPDPNYDQSPQFAVVSQGPESLMPERLKLDFFAEATDEFEAIDSGFGPFGLTRLAYETGGIYFAVHPNRDTGRAVSRGETAVYSSHLRYFFNPDVMKRYKPDYVSFQTYAQRASANDCRQALVQAAQLSAVADIENPQRRFTRFDEAEFVNQVSLAQRAAAILEPGVDRLYQILRAGEPDRSKELSPRWQAGFDLAWGRILAAKVRIESYNGMLALIKTGLKFTNERNNTWVLQPADSIETGSAAANMADKAREYLNRVVRDHPDTPWAMLAQRELDIPIGWKWTETYTEPPRPPEMQDPGNNNNAAPPPPQPGQNAMPKPRREPPRL